MLIFTFVKFYFFLEKEVVMRMLQAEVDEKISAAREASRTAKAKDREIEMLGSQLIGKQFFTFDHPSHIFSFAFSLAIRAVSLKSNDLS